MRIWTQKCPFWPSYNSFLLKIVLLTSPAIACYHPWLYVKSSERLVLLHLWPCIDDPFIVLRKFSLKSPKIRKYCIIHIYEQIPDTV